MKLRLAFTLAVALVGIAIPSSAGAFRFEGGRWPTATIPYYNEVPAYSWAVDSAAYAWNTSGARVRFLKSSRRNAKVLIGIRWFKAAGDAEVQGGKAGFISAKVGIQSGQDRYTMALVVAHEFGHVLGLAHDDRGCATMNSTLLVNHMEHCAAPPPGMWVCRLLHTDDVRGAVRLYGGTVRPARGPEFCTK